jgi:hypothetical protein
MSSTRSEIGDPYPVKAVCDPDLAWVPSPRSRWNNPALSRHRARSPYATSQLCGWVVSPLAGCGADWPCGVLRPGGGFCRSFITWSALSQSEPLDRVLSPTSHTGPAAPFVPPYHAMNGRGTRWRQSRLMIAKAERRFPLRIRAEVGSSFICQLDNCPAIPVEPAKVVGSTSCYRASFSDPWCRRAAISSCAAIIRSAASAVAIRISAECECPSR